MDFNFDYFSELGVASAPNSAGTTVGVFIQVNTTDNGPVNEGETYIIYPNGQSVTAGDFILTADLYVWNDGLVGSAEHGMLGAFLDPNDPVAPYEFGTEGGPLAWVYSGEGGDGSGDLGHFLEGDADSTGYEPISDYNNWPADSIPGFETGVEGSRGPAVSDPSGSWVEVRIVSSGSTVEWYLNGALIDTYDNSGGFYTSGNVFVGTSDVFNSANGNNGAIIDNVVVRLTGFTPTPTPSHTPTATATVTPSATETLTPTATLTASETATPTLTGTSTPTASATATVSSSSPTATATGSSESPTPTSTATVAASDVPAVNPSGTMPWWIFVLLLGLLALLRRSRPPAGRTPVMQTGIHQAGL